MAQKLPLVLGSDGLPRQLSTTSDTLQATTPVNPTDVATKDFVENLLAGFTLNGNGVVEGCGVSYSGTGLVFNVSAGTYVISGVTYTLPDPPPILTVTLDAADPTYPRIDLIIVDNTNTATKITGTPSANPVAPSTVDPATQLQLTFVYVAAGATTPGNIVTTLLFDENVGASVEWNSSSSGAGWTLGSTNNAYSGTKDIEATSVGTSAYVQLQKGSGSFDLSTQNTHVLYIRSKATWGANRSLSIAVALNGVQVGNAITLRDGIFGFNSSNVTSYQQIVISASTFQAGSSPINQIRFTVAGSGGSIGFYLDLLSFQSGVTISNVVGMLWLGAWSAVPTYAKNSVVVSSGIPWVALIPNVNSQPTFLNTNWQAMVNQSIFDFIYVSGDLNSPEIMFGDDGTIMVGGLGL